MEDYKKRISSSERSDCSETRKYLLWKRLHEAFVIRWGQSIRQTLEKCLVKCFMSLKVNDLIYVMVFIWKIQSILLLWRILEIIWRTCHREKLSLNIMNSLIDYLNKLWKICQRVHWVSSFTCFDLHSTRKQKLNQLFHFDSRKSSSQPIS